MPKKPARPKRAKPGPKPDVLKIDGMGWEDAVKKSFQRKNPAGGRPR